MHFAGALLLLVVAAVIQDLVVAEPPATCDASKPNYGCSYFGRCETSQRTCHCNTGFKGDGRTCTSSCSNAATLCNSTTSVACLDMPNGEISYRCACKEGYFFDVATKTCEDVNECNFQVCSPYSECVNEIGGYQCKCCYSKEGWEGISGFGYVGDGKVQCYADSIIHYGESDNSRFRNTPGYFRSNIPGGFPYFGLSRWDIYFHTDGVISFDSPSIPYYGSEFMKPTHTNTKFIAPFWTRLKASSTSGSGLYLDAYNFFERGHHESRIATALWSSMTERGLITELGLSGFQPRVILVATWKNMEAADYSVDGYRTRITFQTVLVTNGSHAFHFTSFAENPKDTDWNAPLDGVYIGQAHQMVAVRRPAKDISQLFQHPPDVENVCSTMTFLTQRGRWYGVFGPPFVENNLTPCLDEATKQKREYGIFGLDENDEGTGRAANLYCPCFEQQALSDNRFVLRNIKDVTNLNRMCHISRFFQNVTYESKSYIARAFCCYDEQGVLVTRGNSAGGVVPDGNEEAMIKLKQVCCHGAPLCEAFHRIYRPVTCHGYHRPDIAYIRGPAHFNSFTNAQYTFNGRGEFTYLKTRTPQMEVQVRLVNQSYPSGATSFLKAISIHCHVPADENDSDPSVRIPNYAEIRVNKTTKQLELLFNGTKQLIPYLPEERTAMFYTACTPEICEVTCKFSSTIYSYQIALVNDYLELNTTIPAPSEVFSLTITGLVGSIGGELKYVDKDTGSEEVVKDLSDDNQVQKFGEAWQTNSGTSIFNYDQEESWDSYNDLASDYKPSTWPEFKPKVNADNVETLMHCGSDYNCQFDQLLTEDKEISLATRKSYERIQSVRNTLDSVTPQWSSTARLVISIHRDGNGNLGDFIKHDELGNGVKADFFDVYTNLPSDLFRFDRKTGDYTLFTMHFSNAWRYESYHAVIYAGKNGPGSSVVARSRWEVEFFICACDKESQCDYDYANRTYLEIPANANNYYLLPCLCPAQTNEQFCDQGIITCAGKPCNQNATCYPSVTVPAGYRCRCNNGYSGNGYVCSLNECPEDHGCSHFCHLDPTTVQPVCTCKSGYRLKSDGKTCEDINECEQTVCDRTTQICRNTPGGFYCECAAGYKPRGKPVTSRTVCAKAPFTYSGTIEFKEYWNLFPKKWIGWSDELSDPSSVDHIHVAGEVEVELEFVLKLMEPSKGPLDEFGTFISKMTPGNNARMVVHYLIYPSEAVDATLIQTALREYFTKMPDGTAFKGVVANTLTFKEVHVQGQCNMSSPCGTPFATCYTSNDDGKICQCNAGFIDYPLDFPIEGVTSCASYCFIRNCDKMVTHSCRDIPSYGPQCLCKKGYRLDEATNECKQISYCKDSGTNTCGIGADCVDSLGSYECKCQPGFIPSNKPAPAPFCLEKVLYYTTEDGEAPWPEGVQVTSEDEYTKVVIPVGFPFDGSEQYKLFISPNGVISFGNKPTTVENYSFFPSTFGYFIAPLWSDFNWQDAVATLHIYDETLSKLTIAWQETIEQIRSDIQAADDSYPFYKSFGYPSIPDALDFNPKTVVVVTWRNLRLKPFTVSDYASFQVVIASDGVATVVIANYDTLASATLIETWDTYPHRGFVGFQSGTDRLCLQKGGFFKGGEDRSCRTFSFSQLTKKISVPLPAGRHVFLVSNEPTVTTAPDRKCFDTLNRWVKEDNEKRIELNYVYAGLSQLKALPDPCPWTETQVKLDPRFAEAEPEKEMVCYQKLFFTEFNYQARNENKTANIRAHCCYRNGALLTHSRGFSHLDIEEFSDVQNDFFNDCCVSSSHCLIASLIVPPYYVSSDYEPPMTVGVFGDPHLVAVQYSNPQLFKGRGDYVLYDHAKLKLHGRFDKLANVYNGSALMGLAWRVGEQDDDVVVLVDSDARSLSVTVGGKAVDVKAFTKDMPFNTKGDIRTKRNDADATEFTVTYVDGLSFDVTMLKQVASGAYLQMRLRLPRKVYCSDPKAPTGLLGNLIQPTGEVFQDNLNDDDYFHNFGKHWALSKVNGPQLFPTPFNSDYVPPFYSTELINHPDILEPFQRCQQALTCAYDFYVTGDELFANNTMDELLYLAKLRREAGERPPLFKNKSPLWMIHLKSPMFQFVPEMYDPGFNIVFSMETDFPHHLYILEPATGRFIIRMTDEARNTLLNKGPFSFNMIARRGATGVSSYMPIAVRICNCEDLATCDFSDDAISVGIIPSANAKRYSSVRCNCKADESGKYCEQSYDACASSPCYPGVACRPPLTCMFGCPSHMEGDGFHCLPEDPCRGYVCSPAMKVCESNMGMPKCVCPPGTKESPDGTNCQPVKRCSDPSQPPACDEKGMKCNDAENGKHWCSCLPGYAPVYESSFPPRLQRCHPIGYAYHGQVSFDSYYHPTQDLVQYSPIYSNVPTDEYKIFAINITKDLLNAIKILKYDIFVGISIEKVSPYRGDFNGFTVDFFAHSEALLNAEEIQNGLMLYYDMTHSVGTLVRISPYTSFFVDICNSKTMNPCQDIIDIATCRQLGVGGVGPTCECKRSLNYFPYPISHPNGSLECQDMCDAKCKSSDTNSKCIRPNGRAGPFECVCIKDFIFNNETSLCEEKPPICTPTTCGQNADCIPNADDTDYKCVCRPGFTLTEGVCISYCNIASHCANVSHAFGCTNMDNGYKCNCEAGYLWNAVQLICQEVDECALGLFKCPKNSKCVKNAGNYSCVCDEEYTYFDGLTCWADTIYPYNFSANKAFIEDADDVWNTTFLSGFYFNDNILFNIFIGFDGFISFDSRPPFKYFGKKLTTSLIAPFWIDLDRRAGSPQSGLHIDKFDKLTMTPDKNWQKVFKKAFSNLKLQYSQEFVPDNTVPDMVLVATWNDVTVAPTESYKQYRTTFQAVLTMMSGFSFVVLNYLEKPTETKWPSLQNEPYLQPLIGYTFGTRTSGIVFKGLNGDPPSFSNIFVDNTKQTRGRHVIAFSYNADLKTRQCVELYRNFPANVYNTIVEINNNTHMTRHACPGFLKQMQVDPRWHPEIELSDASVTCYGGNFWTAINVPSGNYSVRSFCCYDQETGAWLDNKPPARHVGTFFEIKEFSFFQETLFETCCRHSPYCEAFSMKHPSDSLSADNYDPPSIGYVIGDPHLGIMAHIEDYAGRELTFNGQGEYTLVKSGEYPAIEIEAINMQVRFSVTKTTSKATFATGIAVKVGSTDTVEVFTHGGELRVFRKGVKQDLAKLNRTGDVIAEGLFDLWAEPDFVGFVTHSGIALAIYHVDKSYLEIRVTLPNYLENHFEQASCGLLASFDDEPFIDCDGKSETIGTDIWKNDTDAFVYGQRFKLADKRQSLFSYKEGPSFETINNVPSDWKPVFMSDLIGQYPSDANSVCGDSTACKFDYAVTFSQAIAKQTRTSSKKFQMDQLYNLALRPQVFKGREERLVIRASNSPNLFAVKPFGVMDNLFYNIDTNIPSNFYTFDDLTGAFKMQITDALLIALRKRPDAPYLRFWAIGKPTADILTPATFTCACDKVSQCDFDYMTLPYVERLSNMKHNYFLPCNCPPTRRGAFCEIPFNPCDEKPCLANVKCSLNETSPTGFTCGDCPPGFISTNGICRPKVCPDGHCTNGDCEVSPDDSSFQCKCWPGFDLSPDNKRLCLDIDECKLGTHDCYRLGQGMQCNNIFGSFVCTCRPGYYPDSRIIIHECTRGKNQLNGIIKMDSVIVGSMKVTWSPDLETVGTTMFTLAAEAIETDLFVWYETDLGQFDVKRVVVNKLTQGSIKADYSVYFGGSINVTDIEKKQSDYFSTSKTIGDIQGADPATAKVTTDLCKQDTTCDLKSTKCVWVADAGAARCDCLAGFITNPKSATSCIDDCPGICETKRGPYAKCSRDAASPWNYTCDCLANYIQDSVTGRCVDKCASKPCQNSGICAVTGTGFVCDCPANYFGKTCEKKCECLNGGTCAVTGNDFVCACPANYFGKKCEKKCECQHGGTCSVTADDFVCKCLDNFYGKTCESKCDCQHNGTCDTKGSCWCQAGYAGDKCESKINAERVVKETDNTIVIIVGCVLGGATFILLCVSIYFMCTRRKKNADGTARKSSEDGDAGDFELTVQQPAVHRPAPVPDAPVPAPMAPEPKPDDAIEAEPSPPSPQDNYYQSVPVPQSIYYAAPTPLPKMPRAQFTVQVGTDDEPPAEY